VGISKYTQKVAILNIDTTKKKVETLFCTYFGVPQSGEGRRGKWGYPALERLGKELNLLISRKMRLSCG